MNIAFIRVFALISPLCLSVSGACDDVLDERVISALNPMPSSMHEPCPGEVNGGGASSMAPGGGLYQFCFDVNKAIDGEMPVSVIIVL